LSRALARLSSRGQAIQRQVERQDVDARLAEQAKPAASCMLVDEVADAIFRHVARLCDTRHLEQGRGRRDIRVETAARRGHEVDRNRSRWIFLLELLYIALDAL